MRPLPRRNRLDATLDTDPLQLLLDVMRGIPAPEAEPHERRELRERLEAEVAEIRAADGVVWIPSWTPCVDLSES